MSLSVSKCAAISFTRKTRATLISCVYTIASEPLARKTVVNDLRILLDERLTFKAHINQVVQRSKAIWAFVKRQAKEFNCPYVMEALFCALVRSKLEYCSVVWLPVFDCDNDRIESIQKQFVLFALRHLSWSNKYSLPSYERRLALLNMECQHP